MSTPTASAAWRASSTASIIDSFGSRRAFGSAAARCSASSFSFGEPQGSKIVSGASAWPSAIVLPKLSMDEAVTLARNAALAIGVDTGLTHIAAAFVRPTIELYCDSPKWKTEGNWSPRIVNLGELGAPPSVAEVTAAAARLMGPA